MDPNIVHSHRPERPFTSMDSITEEEAEALETIYESGTDEDDFMFLVSVISDAKVGARLGGETQPYTGTREEVIEKIESDTVFQAMTKLNIPFDAFIIDLTGHVYQFTIQVSKDIELLEKIPYSTFMDIEEEHENGAELIGEFLGIPEEDTGWFDDFANVNAYNIDHASECLDRALTIEEYICLQAIPYFPRPTEEGVKRGIENGRKYLESMVRLDKKVDLDLTESSVFYLIVDPNPDTPSQFSIPHEVYNEPKQYVPSVDN